MANTTVVTARLGDPTLALLDQLAASMDRSRAWIVARAIERYVTEETEFLAFLQVGIDDLEAGRSISHDELIARIKDRRGERKAA